MVKWKASGTDDLPLLSDDVEWDGDKAEDQIFKWAGWPDDPNPEKARKGFFAYDADNADEKQGYKLPLAYVREGKLYAVPRGLYAVAVVLEGGRGGVKLPRDVIQAIRKRVERYYEKMGEEVPW